LTQSITTAALQIASNYNAASAGVAWTDFFLHSQMRYAGGADGHTAANMLMKLKRRGIGTFATGAEATSTYTAGADTEFRWMQCSTAAASTGKACSLFILNTSLSDGNRLALETALANSWGI
jgi:hypothetical protein